MSWSITLSKQCKPGGLEVEHAVVHEPVPDFEGVAAACSCLDRRNLEDAKNEDRDL